MPLDWITPITGVVAAVVPAALFLVERRDRKAAEARAEAAELRERTELEAREKAQADLLQREQAERVHAWVATVDDAVGLMMMNSSVAPVADLNFDVMTYTEGVETPRNLLYGLVVLPPTGGEAWFRPLSEFLQFDDIEEHEAGWSPSLLVLREFQFTDANGRRWVRSFEGFATTTLALR